MSILDIPLERVLDEIDYVPARRIRETKNGDNRYIVVHCMGTPQTPRAGGRARNNASYGQTTTRLASWTIGVDNVTAIRSAPDDRGVYGAAGLNFNGLHLEIPGNESLTRDEWLSEDYGLPALRNAAYVMAAWSLRHDIPLVYVGVDGLLDPNGTGVVTHLDSTLAFNVKNGHTDPGPNFPMDRLLELANAYRGGSAPRPQEWDEMATKEEIRAEVTAAVTAAANAAVEAGAKRPRAIVHDLGGGKLGPAIYEAWPSGFRRHIPTIEEYIYLRNSGRIGELEVVHGHDFARYLDFPAGLAPDVDLPTIEELRELIGVGSSKELPTVESIAAAVWAEAASRLAA